jgi:hypothetical protein
LNFFTNQNIYVQVINRSLVFAFSVQRNKQEQLEYAIKLKFVFVLLFSWHYKSPIEIHALQEKTF